MSSNRFSILKQNNYFKNNINKNSDNSKNENIFLKSHESINKKFHENYNQRNKIKSGVDFMKDFEMRMQEKRLHEINHLEQRRKEWKLLNDKWMELRRERFKSDLSVDIESENNDPTFINIQNQNINLCIKEKNSSESSSSDEVDNQNIIKKCNSYDDLVETQNLEIEEYNIVHENELDSQNNIKNNDIIKNYYQIENISTIEMEYNEKYNVKYLTHIANFYNIQKYKKNCKKNELIQMIVLYETNISHLNNVIKRINYFQALEFLKKDKYLASFIMFP